MQNINLPLFVQNSKWVFKRLKTSQFSAQLLGMSTKSSAFDNAIKHWQADSCTVGVSSKVQPMRSMGRKELRGGCKDDKGIGIYDIIIVSIYPRIAFMLHCYYIGIHACQCNAYLTHIYSITLILWERASFWCLQSGLWTQLEAW